MFVLQVYKSNDYNVKFALLQLPINGLKTRRRAFDFCPKQDNKNDGVVLNRVCVLELFCPKESQRLKTVSGSPIPKYCSSSPSDKFVSWST